MISAQEFINQTIGKKKDMDGAYGSQCWDYFAYFESLAGYARTNCTQTGFVADIWNYRKSNGVMKNFKEVSKSSLQKGDWIIWTKSPYGSYSHIAMFVEYAGNNKVKVISQNQSNTMEACYATLTMNGIGGCLRPNCYPTQSKPKPSKPSTPSTKYKVGDTVNINGIYVSKDSKEKLKPAVSSGKITKIYAGANNPYLIGDGTGFVNDACITGKKGSTSSKTLKVGMKAKPKKAISYDGVKLDSFVTKKYFKVIEVKGKRVALGDGLNTAFNIDNLTY